jgi:GAF domain-containing protein
MTTTSEPTALVAAISGALAEWGEDDRALLASIVNVARSIFGAAASSIFLYDHEAGELVFEAVAGEGAEFLIGTRFPADRGIAGWVAATGEPMVVDDLASSALFARDLAESTRYVPNAIMAAPVLHHQEVLGVLQVLDPHPQSRSSIADLDLLMMFAGQAGLSLNGLTRGRTARAALHGAGAEFERLADMVRLLADLPPERRAAGLKLVDSLQAMLIELAV